MTADDYVGYPVDLLNGVQLFMDLGHQQQGVLLENDLTDGFVADLRRLRQDLAREEHREYQDAEEDDDLVEIADGCLDQIVIAWGTLLAYFGPDLAHAMATEVTQSNLAKVDGRLAPVKFRHDGKILKPEGWQPPDIEGVLRRAGVIK